MSFEEKSKCKCLLCGQEAVKVPMIYNQEKRELRFIAKCTSCGARGEATLEANIDVHQIYSELSEDQQDICYENAIANMKEVTWIN